MQGYYLYWVFIIHGLTAFLIDYVLIGTFSFAESSFSYTVFNQNIYFSSFSILWFIFFIIFIISIFYLLIVFFRLTKLISEAITVIGIVCSDKKCVTTKTSVSRSLDVNDRKGEIVSSWSTSPISQNTINVFFCKKIYVNCNPTYTTHTHTTGIIYSDWRELKQSLVVDSKVSGQLGSQGKTLTGSDVNLPFYWTFIAYLLINLKALRGTRVWRSKVVTNAKKHSYLWKEKINVLWSLINNLLFFGFIFDSGSNYSQSWFKYFFLTWSSFFWTKGTIVLIEYWTGLYLSTKKLSHLLYNNSFQFSFIILYIIMAIFICVAGIEGSLHDGFKDSSNVIQLLALSYLGFMSFQLVIFSWILEILFSISSTLFILGLLTCSINFFVWWFFLGFILFPIVCQNMTS